MNIEGTYTLQATIEDVRRCLADFHMLQRTLPGVKQFEALGEKQCNIALDVEHGPLAGHYLGHATLIEAENPHHFHFTFEGEGQQSKIRSDWTLALDGDEQYTVVSYKASVSMGKPGKSMPTSLVKGAIKLLIQEFFTSVAQQLASIPTNRVADEANERFEEDKPLSSSIHASSLAAQPAFAYTLVRRLHLGGGDARAEEQWARRVRRFGITSILLFLVWVGTRLPRKLSRH